MGNNRKVVKTEREKNNGIVIIDYFFSTHE